MLLLNRTMVTTGDMEVILPLVQELVAVAQKDAGVHIKAWAGFHGYALGTVVFSATAESVAESAANAAKLSASKAWREAGRKFRSHVQSKEADTILQYIRGGSMGNDIPVGTIVQATTFQVAQDADWVSALKWANDFADVKKKVTGTDTNVLHTVYGVLGGIGMLTGFANAAAVDTYREKISANPEFMTKFLEGAKLAVAGTVLQRQIIKIV